VLTFEAELGRKVLLGVGSKPSKKTIVSSSEPPVTKEKKVQSSNVHHKNLPFKQPPSLRLRLRLRIRGMPPLRLDAFDLLEKARAANTVPN
jgi:hypothetical protein